VNEAQVGKGGGIIMLFGFVQPSNIRSFHGLTLRALEMFVQNSLRKKSKWKVFRADFLVVTMQDGDAAFRAEFRLAGIAGVEKQNSASRLAKPFVRVAENDCVRPLACDSRFQPVRRRLRMDDVMNQEFFFRKLDGFRFPEGNSRVVVSQHCGYGRDFFQLRNDLGKADVARVQNVSYARKKMVNFRVEEIVGVGDDADFHAFASSGVSFAPVSSSCTPAFFSTGDSAGAVSFAAPANNAVKIPPLKSVLRKNSHVVG